MEGGIPCGWRWVALELVNSAPKEYLAFPEVLRQPGLGTFVLRQSKCSWADPGKW